MRELSKLPHFTIQYKPSMREKKYVPIPNIHRDVPRLGTVLCLHVYGGATPPELKWCTGSKAQSTKSSQPQKWRRVARNIYNASHHTYLSRKAGSTVIERETGFLCFFSANSFKTLRGSGPIVNCSAARFAKLQT